VSSSRCATLKANKTANAVVPLFVDWLHRIAPRADSKFRRPRIFLDSPAFSQSSSTTNEFEIMDTGVDFWSEGLGPDTVRNADDFPRSCKE
jgi:hypothetical protein